MKIYIIGIVAAGKTTYSRRLSEELGIPAYELDRIIFLDPPLKLRKKRIFERWKRQRRGEEQCDYKPSFHMLRMMYRWTRNFEVTRPAFEDMLSNYAEKLEHITEPV